MSAWQEYKKKLGTTRPWDLLKPGTQYVDEPTFEQRFSACQGCDRFIKNTQQCRECGCFMKLKAKLEDATCPLHKW